MASGAGSSSLKVATAFAFVVCIMLVVVSSSAAAPAPKKKLMCRKCDKMCSSSTDGCTSTFCSSACGGDAASSSGCLSCKQAYYGKCKNLCMNSCLATCVKC